MNPRLVSNRNVLVAALRQRGVDYLAPSDATLAADVDGETLIASLAAHSDPRLRQALIALFLLQPELAPLVPPLSLGLEPDAARELLSYYMAALYLQEMWWLRLSRYLPAASRLPDHFSAQLLLPKPEVLHGKAGLHALSEWQAGASAHGCNHLSEYEGVAELLFGSLKLKSKGSRFESSSER